MFSYVNRKNITYYLHMRRTVAGRTVYVMTRSSADALQIVPPGMEIVEKFTVQRMGYSGAGGWRFVARVSLQEALRAYLPRLGKPSFFEM